MLVEIGSYGGQGGRGRDVGGQPSPSYLYLQAQDSLTQKATHRHRNNPSTHPHVGLNISQAPADLPHILSRRREKFPKAHPPPSALSPPSPVRPLCSASHTGSAARVSSAAQASFFSFDVRSRLLLLLLPPTCCQSKHTPQCPANITPSVEQAAPLSLICLKWLWWEGKWPENEGNVGLGQMRWPNVGQKCAAQDLRLLLCPLVGKAFQFYSRCKKSEGIFYVVRTTPATIFCQLSSISLIDLVSVMANEDYAKHERGFEKKKVFFPPLTTMWKKMY